ncbi:hypothetical protein [Oscillatoria salina]|uniref:hypothetical protein n=1 Tax=Oscillatoria salina TaxID=331517 RepID=UPI0013B915A2|nr:hypothetical protein [Oscillatoria salina]MBZ8179798.1 hypothetical protein [Oscillatoria salina IIICB1]NET87691.1 hypothetical protein [Kamptonema sp. SIO1D9]
MSVLSLLDSSNRHLLVMSTNGYNLKFYFQVPNTPKSSFLDTIVEFSTKVESVQKVSVRSQKFPMCFDDLRRLSNYLKNHLQNIKNDPDYESHTFVDYNLTYQIQALCGEYSCSDYNENYFSICSMVNIVKRSPSSSAIYIGGESTISFLQTEEFILNLKKIISLAN